MTFHRFEAIGSSCVEQRDFWEMWDFIFVFLHNWDWPSCREHNGQAGGTALGGKWAERIEESKHLWLPWGLGPGPVAGRVSWDAQPRTICIGKGTESCPIEKRNLLAVVGSLFINGGHLMCGCRVKNPIGVEKVGNYYHLEDHCKMLQVKYSLDIFHFLVMLFFIVKMQ